MSNMSPSKSVTFLVAFTCLALNAVRADAHELRVGRSPTNQIVVVIAAPMPFHLPPSEFPGFDGFAATDPGFVAIGADIPDQGFFTLPPTSDLEFILLGATPHMQVWNDHGSAPMEIGEVYHIGQPLFHNHPLWHSPDGTSGEVYSLTIQLRDRSGALTDSEIYVLEFEPEGGVTPGDVDGDGDVDLSDLTAQLSSFGLCEGDAGFEHHADFDGDECIGLGDLTILLSNFGG